MLKILVSFLLMNYLLSTPAQAACGGTTLTWNSANNRNWTTASNWLPANVPDSASEDVVIINTGMNSRVTANTTVGCVDVHSGTLEGASSLTLSVAGDYFNAPFQNTLNITNSAFVIDMIGTSPQQFTALDNLRDLKLSNNSEVTLNGEFTIASDLIFNSTGKTYVTGTITQSTTGNTTTIPAGHTLVLKSGSTFYFRGSLVVNGILKIEAGALLKFYRNKTLTINPGGILQLIGAPGNPAKISSEATSLYFDFVMNGTMIANNFQILRPSTAGVQIGGVVSELNNGEIRGMNTNGYAINLSSTASIPSTINTIGFFNDDDRGSVKNFNATNYTGGVTTIYNYSGDVAGAAFEVDPSSKIEWDVPAVTEISIINDAESGEPGTTFNPSIEQTFAEFAFTLTQSDVATDITQINLTMTGTASMSDLESVTAYLDTNANCNYNNTDTLIGSLSFTGYPPKATINLNPGDLTTANPTQQACIIIRAKSDANPTDQKTVKFGIMTASDIVNSQNYNISSTSGTPIETGTSTLRNTNYASWEGGVSPLWSDVNNWRNGVIPTSTIDCQIGAALNAAQVNLSPVYCSNATLQTNGIIDWNNSTNIYEIYGSLTVQSSFIFQNAANGNISFNGTNNQSLALDSAFPGSLILNNTGVSGSNILTITSNSTVQGNFTCNSGVLNIPANITLSVLGNMTLNSGCSLEIAPGGSLALGNNSTLQVSTGATLQIIGNSSLSSSIKAVNSSSGIQINVLGTIKANYYSIENLKSTGLNIAASAIIDTTNNLSNGSFIYPAANSTTFLTLMKAVPGNTLSGMNFNSNGSSASSVMNIDTTNVTTGVLTINSYSGDLAGPSFDNDGSYAIDWQGQTNTLDFELEENAPATVTVGNIYKMARFSLKQTLAGASYDPTDITKISLTLTGTGVATDITSANLYLDTNCDGLNGISLGSQTFSGNPAKATFNISSGVFTIAPDLSSPVKNCFYVEYSIASAATNNSTVGVKIASAADIDNTQNYTFSSTKAPPLNSTNSVIDAPTTTIWTGTTNSAWDMASNWSSGIPNLNKTCQIPNTTNKPTITTAASCKNLDITTGTLTIGATGSLSIYGNLNNTGVLTQSGSLIIADGGVNLSHTLNSTSPLTNLTIAKTGGGVVSINDTELIVNQLSITGTSFRINIASGFKLVLPNGASISAGELRVSSNGTLEIGQGQTLTINGGIFSALGTNDTFPQSASAKGRIRPQGEIGTWNFNATSGTVNLKGFHFDRLSESGLVIGGSTILQELNGGQFTNLSSNYASLKAIQINTTGSIPASAANIAWNWGNFNTFTTNPSTPSNTQSYKLVSSSGCSSQSIDFSGWTGDWYETTPTFDIQTKISSTNCNISMSNATSSVSLNSLNAHAYSNAIELAWQTNSEINHLGFNVFRTDVYKTSFIQINPVLLKNINNGGNKKGSYTFFDYDVKQGQTYYYYIEDIDLAGISKLHGPVFASIDQDLSPAPNPTPGDNTGRNPKDSEDDNDDQRGSNPSYKDLGNGIAILNQTQNAVQLRITPAEIIFTTAIWDQTYDDASISGYSKLIKQNYPELPSRVLLIDVSESATTAQLLDSKITKKDIQNHKISPVPFYTKINGTLTTNFEPDDHAYNSQEFYPQEYFKIDENLIKDGDKKFLKITINPLLYMAATSELSALTQLDLSIGLDGNDWSVDPGAVGDMGLNNKANTIKIGVDHPGVYKLGFDELENNNTHHPIKDSDISEIRAYLDGREIAIDIDSSDSYFNNQDYIYFVIPKLESKEIFKEVFITLSDTDLLGTGQNPLRMTTKSAALSDDEIAAPLARKTKYFEDNFIYVDGESLGDNLDHFFWKHIQSYPGLDKFTENFSISDLELNSSLETQIVFNLKGAQGFFGNEFEHHIRLSVNEIVIDDLFIDHNNRTKATFDIPNEYLSNGVNTLTLEVLGTFAPSSDYDRVYINSFEINYTSNNYAQNDKHIIYNTEIGENHIIHNFSTSDIRLYEYINHEEIYYLEDIQIDSTDNGASYFVKYFQDDEIDNYEGKYIFAHTANSYEKIKSSQINTGLKKAISKLSGAELVLIAEESLLAVANDFIKHKTSMGLKVLKFTPQEIYNEYTNSKPNPIAFSNFARAITTHWNTKAKYLLIIGDASSDPHNYNINSAPQDELSATEKQTIPTLLSKGRFMEFLSDNLITKSESNFALSIGRIPSNSPTVVKNYLNKVIDYENGKTKPSELKHMTFVADKDQGYYEDFKNKVSAFANTTKNFSSTLIDANNFTSKEETRAKIIESFNSDNFMISLMGHGASDRFGDGTFLNANAKELSNQTLPIVATWNCETAAYFYPNKNETSLGENLIFNQTSGAIAFIGPVTQTTPTAQFNFASIFYATLDSQFNQKFNGQRLGDILRQTQNTLINSDYDQDIIFATHILGDPSLLMPKQMYKQDTASSDKSPKAGGCSANASSGNSTPWYFGFFELLFCLSLIKLFSLTRTKKSLYNN